MLNNWYVLLSNVMVERYVPIVPDTRQPSLYMLHCFQTLEVTRASAVIIQLLVYVAMNVRYDTFKTGHAPVKLAKVAFFYIYL